MSQHSFGLWQQERGAPGLSRPMGTPAGPPGPEMPPRTPGDVGRTWERGRGWRAMKAEMAPDLQGAGRQKRRGQGGAFPKRTDGWESQGINI